MQNLFVYTLILGIFFIKSTYTSVIYIFNSNNYVSDTTALPHFSFTGDVHYWCENIILYDDSKKLENFFVLYQNKPTYLIQVRDKSLQCLQMEYYLDLVISISKMKSSSVLSKLLLLHRCINNNGNVFYTSFENTILFTMLSISLCAFQTGFVYFCGVIKLITLIKVLI